MQSTTQDAAAAVQQQQQQQQDGKLALIKNQLHLIEQLQLENANLRNERDQLQLENEELKFQLQMISSSAILGQHHESTFGGNQFDQLIDDAEAAAAAAAVAAATSKRNDANGPTPTSDIDTPLHVASRPANVESPQRAPLTAERATSEKQAGTMRLVGDASDDESVQQRLATFKIGVASPVRDFPTGNDAAAQHDGVDRMSTPSSASSSSSSSSSDPVEQAATRSVTTQPNQQAPPVQDSVIKRLHDLTKSMFAPFETIISDKPATNSNHKPMIEPKQQHNATDANREVNVCTVDTTNDQMPVAPRGSASKECANTAIQMLPQNDEIEITNHNHAFDIMDDNTATSNKPAATEAAVSSAVINTSDSSGISSAADLDDDEHRVKLIEQNYGGNSDRIHTAAVIIQRAFRKYEICKRFRTITEQLRHHQSTTTATPTVTRQSGAGSCSSSGASLSTTVAGSSDKSRDNIITASSANDYDAPGDEFTKRNGSETQQSRHYIAASGATRAAAWESLSYAASCLAAATLSAEQTRQQAKSNNQKRREADEADEAAAAKQQLLNDKSSQTQTEMVVNETINCARNIASPLIIKQQESVYAAALNFQQLEAMRKRQYRVGLYIFNKDPEKGLSFLIAHSFIDSISPFAKTTSGYYHSNQVQFFENKQHLTSRQSFKSDHGLTEQQAQCQLCIDAENLKRNVAHFLLHRKGLAKEKIGQYLGNLQSKFNQDVLVYYLQELDFYGLQIDLALRKFLATFRLPGEAQKIERIVDCFATRYVQCQQQQNHQMPLNVSSLNIAGMSSANSNQTSIASTTSLIGASTITPQQTCYRNNLMLLSKDEIFILTFAIIMLNTDLHAPSLKPTSRMSPIQFVNNLRGIFKSQTINKSDLIEIYERVKANQISTTPDHVMHVMKVQQSLTNLQKMELPNLCVPYRRLVGYCRLFEVYDINKKDRIGQHQREVFVFNDMLLITKLARRVRTNASQLYTYRQSILLHGNQLDIFRSSYHPFGIKISRRSDGEVLIMLNARNELDHSKFVNNLSESIAEIDEIENLRSHGIIDDIHRRHMDNLKRHAALHEDTHALKLKTYQTQEVKSAA